MTTVQVVIAVGLTGILGIIAQHFAYRRELRRYGQEQYDKGFDKGTGHGMTVGVNLGWREGWDDRDNDRYPDTPEPQGKHHGLSQPKDWIGNDLTEFLPQPPLPKRIPGASR